MLTQDNPWGIEVPPLDEDLLTILDTKFPERCPDPEASEREVWMAVGRREVVRWLFDQLQRQQKVSREGGDQPITSDGRWSFSEAMGG